MTKFILLIVAGSILIFSGCSYYITKDKYEEKEKFVKEIEARCPISDNLSNTTPVKIEVA